MKLFQLIVAAIIASIFGFVFLELSPIIFRNPIFLLLLPVIFTLVIVMFINPLGMIYVILATRLVINPIIESSRIGGGMSAGALLNALVILTALIICFKKFKDIFSIPYIRQWILFLSITFITILYSPVKGEAIRLWLNNFSYLCIGMIPFVCITSTKDARKWIILIACSSIIPVMMALGHGAINHTLFSRIAYPVGHASILAHYLVIMIVSVAYAFLYFLPKKAIISKVLKITLVLLVIALVLTQTRNAWIACWACFFMFGIIRKKVAVIILSIGVPLLLICTPFVQERIHDAMINQEQTETEGMNSFAWRKTLWKESFVWIKENPLIGYGLSSFKHYSPEFSKVVSKEGIYAHNVYVELFFETGILGLLAFICIFLMLQRRLIFYYNSIRSSDGKDIAAILIAYIISYLIVCYIDNLQHVLQTNWYVWFLVGIIYQYLRLLHKEEQEQLIVR